MVNFYDPNIVKYDILEDRNNMTEPLNFAENHAGIYFFFADPVTYLPVELP